MKTVLKNKRILIVDDEPDLREMLEFEFDTAGCDVSGANNGREAFDLAQSFLPDAIITDIRMPGGDGIELLKKMQLFNSKIPVLFISGFADIQIEEAYDMGASAFFAKPFVMKEVVEKTASLTLSLKDRWEYSKKETPISLKLTRSYISIENAKTDFGVEFGRGGMLLTQLEKIPRIDSGIEFELEFEKEKLLVKGIGIVKWNKKLAGEKGICCGIDIVSIPADSSERFISMANLLEKSSFIPKVPV